MQRAGGRPPRSARSPAELCVGLRRQVLRCLRHGDRASVLKRRAGPPRRAARRRGSRPPRSAKASSRLPSPQSAWMITPPGVVRHDVRRHGPAHGPELACRHEPCRDRPPVGPVRPGGPRASRRVPTRSETPRRRVPSPPRGPSSRSRAAAPPRSRAQAIERPAAPDAAAALGRHGVGECRGAGMVRAVAITQVRERRQEVPGVAALRSESRRSLLQRAALPGSGPPSSASLGPRLIGVIGTGTPRETSADMALDATCERVRLAVRADAMRACRHGRSNPAWTASCRDFEGRRAPEWLGSLV